MQQMTLFNTIEQTGVVNVASVPQRSPFRYPGGKTWIVPRLRRWLAPSVRQQFGLVPAHPTCLIEPFAGGGIVSLTAAAENLAEHVTMVEIDDDVAAVWQTLLHGEDWSWIAQQIGEFDLTYENVAAFLARKDLTLRERAFKTILRNRVNRGGILAPGAGLVKNGEGGKGLKSRWYPATLKRRIEHIVQTRDCITFIHSDGMNVLRTYSDRNDVVFFIDPPYTAAGKKAGNRLYKHFELDHEELFEIASKLKGDFLMTYDDNDMIRSLAQRYGFDMQVIAMKNTHHATMKELLIAPHLDWLRFS
ncbi:MAG: DNA adenine methylase [Ktedonobacteraceae bacterium]